MLAPASMMIMSQKENDDDDETDADNKTNEIMQQNVMCVVMKHGGSHARGVSMRTNRMIQSHDRIFLSKMHVASFF